MRIKLNQRCHLYSIILLLSSVKTAKVIPLNNSCDPGDLSSLRSFYGALESNPVLDWSFNDSSSNCCNWVGVRCDFLSSLIGPRVIGLDLSGRNLKGFLTNDSFAGFGDQLKHINLSSNFFHGSIPSSLFELPQLELLDLSVNIFSGTIPAFLNLPSIQVFNISFNSCNGTLPILPNSRNLQAFDITGNSFYGNIPSSICNNNSGKIKVLRFSMNKISGDLPAGYGNCTQLTELSVDMNSFAGTLPKDLFNLPNLSKLNLKYNSFTGKLSPKFGRLANLLEVDLSFNEFSGAIPDVFDKLNKLQTFDASSNGFSGSLPPSLSNCSSLKVLILRNNSLTGEINFGFSSSLRLKTIDLGANHFTGTIPFSLPECKQLETLNLARNKLVGEIPSSFVNFTSINYLFSNLSQALQILQNLPKLTTLVLTNNFRGGETVPSEGIIGFSNIRVLVIANCALRGSIPSWLANSIELNVLDMSWNRLTGTVPPWLGNLDNLFYLDISNNSINGQIPESLTHMKSLTVLHNLTKPIVQLPLFVMRNSTSQALQYNQVNSLPPSLILSHNELVGSISPGFGNLKGLMVLDLSFNTLSGIIPNELSGMSNIETFDLSHNDLTGTIPVSLIKLNFLSKFNVAYNNLTGEIPSGGQFSAFPPEYFEGNPGLGDRVNASSSSESQPESSESYIDNGVIIAATIGYGVGILASVGLYFQFFD